MATIIYPSPIFGPVRSRRLGISLGINLMPADGKLCTFDCIYCECGLNAERRPTLPRPTRDEVRQRLEETLIRMRDEQMPPDVLTFAGNGEPTLHHDFAEIIDDTIALRDKYFPKAQVSVLSNATMCHSSKVREALKRIDNNIQKLDTIAPEYIARVDRPVGKYNASEVIENLKAFDGKLIIQTMFMGGEYDGASVDNTSDAYIIPWLEAVRKIAPSKVMIYTIDRETPVAGLAKATPERLDAIAEMVRQAGFECSVSY